MSINRIDKVKGRSVPMGRSGTKRKNQNNARRNLPPSHSTIIHQPFHSLTSKTRIDSVPMWIDASVARDAT